MDQFPRVSSLHFSPIKSCKAVDLDSAYAGPRGLEVGKILDRGWVLIDDNDILVSQRQEPSLARVHIELLAGQDGVADSIRVTSQGVASSIVLAQDSVEDVRQRAIIHREETVGHLAHSYVNQWFSQFLGKSVRAVYQQHDDKRFCDPNFAVMPEHDTVSFADGFQYLVTTKATLEQLNSQLSVPVPMQRFRPNIVVEHTAPEAEYTWRSITAGEASFRLVKPCTRCVMTTVDQELGVKTGNEPLASLARTNFLSQNFGDALPMGKFQSVIQSRL
jgi:uncharacterized protein